MDIDSRYPIRHRLPPGGSGERAGDYINLGLGLSPLPQREKQRTIYSLDHARSGSNLHSASASPLSFRSRHLPAVLDYCLDRNDFHGVSRAEGPGQLTWRSACPAPGRATRNILYIFQRWVMMSGHNRPMLPAATRVHGARRLTRWTK